MAYSQSKKLTAQEKKLLTLRTQLYGKKQPDTAPKKIEKPAAFQFSSPGGGSALPLSNTHSEATYLKNDLQKIGILATVIFSVQALLYIAIQKGFIGGGF